MNIRSSLFIFSKRVPIILFRAFSSGLRPSMGNITIQNFLKQKRFFSLLLPSSKNCCVSCSKLLGHQSLLKSSVSNSSSRVSEKVVLYTFDNLKYLRMVNLFGYSFAAFWAFTSYQFATMRITPPSQRLQNNLPWYARFDLVSSTTRQIAAVFITALVGMFFLTPILVYSNCSVPLISFPLMF